MEVQQIMKMLKQKLDFTILVDGVECKTITADLENKTINFKTKEN
jgi:transcriptional regulator of NAD metabolism